MSAKANFIKGGGKVTAHGDTSINIAARSGQDANGGGNAEANFIEGDAEADLADNVKVKIDAGADEEDVLDFACFLKRDVKLNITWSEAKLLVAEIKELCGIRCESDLKDADAEDREKLNNLKTIKGPSMKKFLKYVKEH